MHHDRLDPLDSNSRANDLEPMARPPVSLSALAQSTLLTRLERVSDLLLLAALYAHHDLEHVHQLRIATRRALAALDAYQQLLSAKETAWLRNRLKRIRSAAGDARDLDVMATRLRDVSSGKNKKLLHMIRQRRTRAQAPLVRIHKRLRRNANFRYHVNQCLESISHDSNQPYSTWVTRQVQEAADAFFASIPKSSANDKSLHRFRIQAKRLRYLLELFDEKDIWDIKSQLYPMVCAIQSTLGELNDHVVAAKRLQKMSRHAKPPRMADRLAKLAKRERKSAEEKRRKFQKKWPIERLHQAQAAFELTRRDLCFCEDPRH